MELSFCVGFEKEPPRLYFPRAPRKNNEALKIKYFIITKRDIGLDGASTLGSESAHCNTIATPSQDLGIDVQHNRCDNRKQERDTFAIASTGCSRWIGALFSTKLRGPRSWR